MAPIIHKIAKRPPIKAKAKARPISISFVLSLIDNPIDIKGLRSINLVAIQSAKKLPAT